MKTHGASREELDSLLAAHCRYPERAAEIEREIQERFACDCAVLVLDLSGFTRLTLRHGIVNFLAIVHRMRTLAMPIVAAHHGRVVKVEADNLVAVFEDVAAATRAALALLQEMQSVSIGLRDEQRLFASIGIGYGAVLLIGDDDLYGNEMNLACKLGEDLARQGEVLLTESAWQRIAVGAFRAQAIPLSVSGVELTAYKVTV